MRQQSSHDAEVLAVLAVRATVLAGRFATGAVVATANAVRHRLLGRLDLTELVAAVVDLDRLVARVDIEAVIARVDIDAIATRLNLDPIIERLDLIGLARYVVNGIDLPELIRESTGSVTADMVRDVRVQSAAADHQLERTIDRLLLRRQQRQAGGPPTGDGADGVH